MVGQSGGVWGASAAIAAELRLRALSAEGGVSEDLLFLASEYDALFRNRTELDPQRDLIVVLPK